MSTLLLALAAAAAPAPAPTAPLPPKKAWVVDYAETFCTAARSYGDDAAPLDFALRPAPNGDVLQFYILRSGGFEPARHVPVTVAFGEQVVKATALTWGPKKEGRRTILINLPREAIADLPRAKAVAFHGGGVDYAFAVPDLDKVMAALATCNDDLRAHWNMTADKKALIATPAKPLWSLHGIINPDDYPEQAVREEDTGQATVMLLVDETGKVADCQLQKTSGNASLDAMTCIAFIKRARFRPARDAAGKPMKDVFYQSIAWRIQG